MEVSQPRKQMFSNKDLVNLTIPVVINSLLTIIAGMVDSAMVSSAGEAAVSAVSLVDAINILCITICSSIAIGGSVVTAQYIGSRNFQQACVSANQLLYASTAVATVLMSLMLCFHGSLLKLIYGSIEPIVYENAKIYFFITLLSYPFSAILNSASAVLRALGKSRQSVAIPFVLNVVNVIGNAILIYGFHLGVAGAAIATAFGRFVSAVFGLILTHRKSLPVRFQKLLRFRLDWDVMRRVLSVGLTNGMENGLFNAGKLLISGLIASFGTIAIAANSAAYTINNLGWVIVSSFSTVMLTVVGQCVGANEPEQAKAYVKKMLAAATVALFVMFGSVFLLRHQLVRLFDFSPETLEICAYYTGVYALFSIFSLYSFSFVPVSAFRAAGDVRYAVTLSVGSMFAFRVGLCFVLDAIFPTMGLMCVCIGMGVDWAFRTVLNIFRYRSGKWLHKRLI